ncbi:redoxin domain-containing protein [Aestuariivivens sediminicola]|uniref:redoxin domain-containing protein n=1 Tax=Aestuariivivens sediminicola TaxID=2913560 RepID=UPI001F55B931|nr:redoxin domain-containing protein [Aestuariivivens sediminicola]
MLRKHPIIQLPIFITASAVYIILKYITSPFIYVFKRMGFTFKNLSIWDASINRAILPLTERADMTEKLDVKTRLRKGDRLPSLRIHFSDESSGDLQDFKGAPLLMVFVRGSWCSYSRLHLSDLLSRQEDFEKAGIRLLAITSYEDQDWWHSHGINIPMCIDKEGEIFDRFGLRVETWMEFAWGRTVPHESAFLFDSKGVLVARDVRKVSSILPGQKFLGSARWLEIAHKYV